MGLSVNALFLVALLVSVPVADSENGYIDEDENLCEDVDCPSGYHCENTIETGPLCVTCGRFMHCPNTQALVCGSDGKTYLNECHMRAASCESGKKVIVERNQACGALPFDPCLGITCAPGYVCEMGRADLSEATLTPRCVCTDENNCAGTEKKACGSHECQPYQDCVLNIRDQHVCCLMDCSSPVAIHHYHRPLPLCGHDRIMYSSLCFMDKVRCLTSQEVTVATFKNGCSMHAHAHRCGPEKYCRASEVCARHENGFSCCPSSYPSVTEPVCGSDGRIYNNIGEMEQHACFIGQRLSEVDMEHCSKLCKLQHGEKEAESGTVYTLKKDNCTKCTCNNGEWLCDHRPCLLKMLGDEVIL